MSASDIYSPKDLAHFARARVWVRARARVTIAVYGFTV